MPLHHFDLFVKTITALPAAAILKTLDLECKTLEDDFEHHRLTLTDDAFSILCFRQFVRMALLGGAMHCLRPLPSRHIEFYRQTVARLIQGHQLPPAAMEEFDFTFTLIP